MDSPFALALIDYYTITFSLRSRKKREGDAHLKPEFNSLIIGFGWIQDDDVNGIVGQEELVGGVIDRLSCKVPQTEIRFDLLSFMQLKLDVGLPVEDVNAISGDGFRGSRILPLLSGGGGFLQTLHQTCLDKKEGIQKQEC